MIFPLEEFTAFRQAIMIPSRDQGLTPFTTLFGTQAYLEREIMRGLEDDIHDFTVLKGGRQVGGTTYFDALTLFWLQKYPGMIGMKISDDDGNMRYRRDVIRQMYDTLPNPYRWPVRMDNEGALAWGAPSHSRLLFGYAGKREGQGNKARTNLGRSRGLMLIDADEVGLWPDQRAVSALRASLSKKHPYRFSAWNGTAQGDNTFKEMCDTAQKAVAQRFIFLAWWQHQGYRVERGTKLFEAYGRRRRTEDERLWIRQVKKRWNVEIQDEQLAWWRWQLHEEFNDDEDMCMQEFGHLPELCFVAFGDKFFGPPLLRRIRAELRDEPEAPQYFRFRWAKHWENCEPLECDEEDATLTVWEKPVVGGVYLVGAKAAFSDDADQPEDVASVWRLYPDGMTQVAEYCTEDSDILQFAWLVMHLCGAYRMTRLPTYLALEVQGTGIGVLAEMRRMIDNAHGVMPKLRTRARELYDFGGSISHYLWRKPDTLAGSGALHWQSTPQRKPLLMHALRAQLQREALTIRSTALLDQLAGLRRGAEGDNDQIGATGQGRDGRVLAAGLAAWHYVEGAMNDVQKWGVERKTPDPRAPRSMAEIQTQNLLRQILASGTRRR